MADNNFSIRGQHVAPSDNTTVKKFDNVKKETKEQPNVMELQTILNSVVSWKSSLGHSRNGYNAEGKRVVHDQGDGVIILYDTNGKQVGQLEDFDKDKKFNRAIIGRGDNAEIYLSTKDDGVYDKVEYRKNKEDTRSDEEILQSINAQNHQKFRQISGKQKPSTGI